MKKYFAAAALAAGFATVTAQAETLTRDCQVYPDKSGFFRLSLDTETEMLTLHGRIQTPGLGNYTYALEPMTGATPSQAADHKLLVLRSPDSYLTAIGNMELSATFNKPAQNNAVMVHVARDWMWGPSTVLCPVPKPDAP